MVPSRVVEQDVSFYQETAFEPASERTLYRVIEVCAAFKQKSLQGLDCFSAEGPEAFDTLQNIISTLEESGASSFWGKEAKDTLKEGKRYLKTNFKSHVEPDETCVDDCTTFSLSALRMMPSLRIAIAVTIQHAPHAGNWIRFCVTS